LSSTASCLRVFPLLPVLCQQLGTLENVWHWPPPTIDSWWSQWRCWSSWSLPSMLLLKVLNMCVTVIVVQAALWSYFLVSGFHFLKGWVSSFLVDIFSALKSL
jgi:hypothetical protein